MPPPVPQMRFTAAWIGVYCYAIIQTTRYANCTHDNTMTLKKNIPMTVKHTNLYGWVVVAAAFIITFVTCGINFSYGVLMLPMINEMGWSRGMMSSVMLIAGAIYSVTLLITGQLSEKYGYRWVLGISTGCLAAGLLLSSQIYELWQLYVYNGLLVGLSLSATYAIPVALVAVWFTKRQGLAVGVATLGISLGTACIPLGISSLIESLDWRTALLITGAAVAIICLPAALLIRQPPSSVRGQQTAENTETTSSWEGLTLAQAVHTKQFWMLFLALLLFLSGLNLMILHIVPFAIDSGLSPLQAAGLLTLVGIFGIAGRLGSGIISDKYGARPVMFSALLLLAGITTMIAFLPQAWPFNIFAALFGLGYTSVATMMVRMARHIFGIRSLGSIFSILMIADGIGMGAGPWLAGYIYDITGGYFITFLAVAVAMVLAALIIVIIKPAKV